MTKMVRAHSKESRPVLLLNLTGDALDYEKRLANIGWECICVTSCDQAFRALTRQKISIAVALMTAEKQQPTYSALTRINALNENLVWIAVSLDNKFQECPFVKQNPSFFFDYYHLPINWSMLGHTLGHALGMAKLRHCAKKTPCQTIQKRDYFFGHSPAIKEMTSSLTKMAQVDATVLICGETGSGKGLCAHWLHEHSKRSQGPFISVNCAALPTNLLHAELFGYEKGAFTSAGKRHIGYIERADRGTLFLDEIGDLSMEAQINLLKFLDDHMIQRLGGESLVPVDCRVIFASHVNLEQAVDKGTFREDLYHRLNILRIQVPALKERREDIELLANHFLQQYTSQESPKSFSPSAIEAMLKYEWPGNVRSLKNRVQRGVVMSDGEIITEKDLGITLSQNAENSDVPQEHKSIGSDTLLNAMFRNNNNISAVARDLCISRTTLYKLIKKYNIKARLNL
ncbi:sigma-54-dependent Fis family transcriptional regulator [Vibrio albus]|uniref:Sigma-54-dependent Fis family transcriptional regulator n=1 Tax=Vibrio albus TaxID=2200953 RepID=A0A2U3BDC5_9VIBR|nr:sigma-54 dependent transcriptional regulator [Vibrio albus]PWI34744.1 sigma-54-dependent Fis family transcriptional regulator [Vibrio albus]